ncbi:MAG: ORF6N domain-containing protein, partial [Proteobacteria bacterium]|nr:ORF6N domain-containing protein [Pseudomonadota bacterium]
MIVTFISQCEKKSLNKTRRVLDAFANRIGNRTWQTPITEEGLQAVKVEYENKITQYAYHENLELYNVQNKHLNEQIKRNIDRFPKKIRFQLNQQKTDELVANCDDLKSPYASFAEKTVNNPCTARPL